MKDKKVVLPNSFISIAEENLKVGNKVKLLADGESMYPFIRGGRDTVEISPVDGNTSLRLYDCFLCKWQNRYIIHRLVGIKDDKWIMAGDGNYGRKEIVGRNDIIGIVKKIIRADGTVVECGDPSWVRKGCFWVKIRPLRSIMLPVIRRINVLERFF